MNLLRRRHPRTLFWPLLVSLLISSHVAVSNALTCYFCYGSSEDCSLPEDENGNRIVDSSTKIISCLTADEFCYRIHYSFNGKPVTGRGCGNETFCDKQRQTRQKYVGSMEAEKNECDLCSRNLCNSSSQLRVTIPASVLIIGLILMMMIFN